MEKKGNIFFDWDDTLVNTAPVAVEYINKKYNSNITEEQFKNIPVVDTEENFFINETLDNFYLDYGDNFQGSYEWNNKIKTMKEVERIIPKLAEKYNLYIVSARQVVGLSVLKKIVDERFPNCFKGVHCVWRRESNEFVPISKKEFIKGIKGNNIAFIDDSMRELKDFNDEVPVYLFNQSDKKVSGIENVDWQRIEEMFL